MKDERGGIGMCVSQIERKKRINLMMKATAYFCVSIINEWVFVLISTGTIKIYGPY